MSNLFIGIDFGTSNMSLAFTLDHPGQAASHMVNVEVVPFPADDEGITTTSRVPTVVCAPFTDARRQRPFFGLEFWRQFWLPRAHRKTGVPLLRRGETLFESVKSDLGSSLLYPDAFDSSLAMPEEAAVVFFKHLYAEAKAKFGAAGVNDAHVFVTVPASLSAEARRQTAEAAKQGGFGRRKPVSLIDEPIAALLDLLNSPQGAHVLSRKSKTVLVFDYGGGTLDLSLVKCRWNDETGLEAEHLAISRYMRNGGNTIDASVMEAVVWPQVLAAMGMARDDIPTETAVAIADTLRCTVARRLKEDMCRKVDSLLTRGGSWEKARSASLVVKVSPRIDFSLPDDLNELSLRDCKMTGAEFDTLMRPFVEIPRRPAEDLYSAYPRSLIAPLLQVLTDAGQGPDSLDVLVLHGGACRNPWVRQFLRQSIPSSDLFRQTSIIETPDLDTSVAKGAAIASYWYGARGREIIRPIATADVGIMTLGGNPVPLVKSGTPLPYPDAEGEMAEYDNFFIPKHRPREMLVPFYCRDGQHCRNTGTIRVDLSRYGDLPKGAPVKINLRVDREKMLHWSYRVGAGDSIPAEAISDPWTSGHATAPWRDVESQRRRMRDTFKTTRDLPPDMQMSEAWLLYRAGALDSAELSVRAVIEKNGGEIDAEAANMLSLIYGDRGRTSEELDYARRAAELNPHNAVYIGNYGYALADAGQTEKAIAQLRRAVEIDETLTYVYERLADIYREDGNEQRAEAELRQALRTAELSARGEPNSSDSWRDIERIARKLGLYDRARDAASRIESARMDESYGGDHNLVIAGPDSPV